MNRIERIHIDPRDRPADGNIQKHYSIENAEWVWLAKERNDAYQAEFKVVIELPEEKETIIHVSADQRYELFWNGQAVGRGPDRSDLRHWSFASYPMVLEAGRHEFRALVTYLGDKAPVAQESYAPGFIFAADGLEKLLNTGSGAWQAKWLEGIGLRPGLTGHYHVIGPGFDIDGAAYFADRPFEEVKSVRKVLANPHGIITPGLVLHPSRLPDQKAGFHSPEKALSTMDGGKSGPWKATGPDVLSSWSGLLEGKSVEVAPNSEMRCLFDMGNYFCGYANLSVTGGTGSEIQVEWAESLIASENPHSLEKGNRNEWEGKHFHGFGDHFLPDGPDRTFNSLWWRSGRYIQVYLKTGDTALTIRRLGIIETGYPANFTAQFDCSDPGMDGIIKVMERGLECCGHEIMVDCPYYEQLSYVGDTRLQALCWMVLGEDDRLVKRELELFDWSRSKTGYVAERYPSDPYQLSLTFSMIWVLLLGDFSRWRDDPEFVRARMPGMRSLLDLMLRLRNETGLLERLPGWSFVDWVDEWNQGIAPGARDGSCVILDLLFLLALRTARGLEDSFGEAELSARWERLANEHSSAIRESYWDSEIQMYTDVPGRKEHLSLHAQSLAVIAGLHSSNEGKALMRRAMKTEGIAWPTPYFQYYLFEALAVAGLGEQILEEMDLWRGFVAKGFKTPPEKEDPTRSDCHAWGSHPLYHLHASIAGIRPSSSGFKKVSISPAPGKLEFIRSEFPVQRGTIKLNLVFKGPEASGTVTMPEGLGGDFYWGRQSVSLRSGEVNRIDLTL